jgi:hypothetical protein
MKKRSDVEAQMATVRQLARSSPPAAAVVSHEPLADYFRLADQSRELRSRRAFAAAMRLMADQSGLSSGQIVKRAEKFGYPVSRSSLYSLTNMKRTSAPKWRTVEAFIRAVTDNNVVEVAKWRASWIGMIQSP